MNAKWLARSLLALLLVAVFLWAGEPWKDKPYTEWTKQDVEKVLGDSPWARPIFSLGETRLATVKEELEERRDPNTGQTVYVPVQRPVPGSTDTRLLCVVSWWSSLTIRQAIAQRYTLTAGAKVQDLLAMQPEHYALVMSPGVHLFSPLSVEDVLAAVRSSAYLQPARSKRKIQPARVEVAQPWDLVFYFPRTLDGDQVIRPGEQNVKFVCPTPAAKIEVKFDLRKMVRDGKPDL